MEYQSNKIVTVKNYTFNNRHCIGEGSYGKVYEGIDTNTNLQVAIKTIDQNIFKNDQYLQCAILAEIEILKRFNHKNIVQFQDIVFQDGTVYIITEFCKDGDLRQFMKANKNLTEEQVSQIFKQILEGIRELHKVGVIHRDLKPANILIHNNEFKIADFGFARDVDFQSDKLLVSCVGSPMYMDPLILSRKPYGTKCDIWSLGIILYELLLGETPYHRSRTEQELLINIYTKQLKFDINNKKISQKMQNLIKQMLQVQEVDRISWEDLFTSFQLPVGEEEQDVNVENLFMCLLNARNNMNYKHYITVDMLEKYIINKQVGNKESIYERLLFYLCLSVKKESEKLLQIVIESEKKKQSLYLKNENLIAITNSLRREHNYYQTIFDDVYNLMIRNGIQNVVFNDIQIGYTIEKKQLSEIDLKNLNIYTQTISKSIITLFLEQLENKLNSHPPQNEEDTQLFISTLNTIHYLIDLIQIESIIQSNPDIPFDAYHTEKAAFEQPNEYISYLQNKFNKLS